jgi:hypothetical protein
MTASRLFASFSVAFGLRMILNRPAVFAQAQDQHPITIHEIVGDTLDARENSIYHIFPKVAHYESAIFLPSPGNTVRARIRISDGTGRRDTNITDARS